MKARKANDLGHIVLGVVILTALVAIWFVTNVPGAGKAVHMPERDARVQLDDGLCLVKGYGLSRDAEEAQLRAISDANRQARDACPGMACSLVEQYFSGDEATVLLACR